MAERAPVVAHRGILAALRAAAIVIIATGLNDVLAGALPRYEPLYLYLAAIALAVFLDGVLLGLFCTLLTLGFYALLFRPPDYGLPVAAAAATVVVAGVIRGLVRLRRREELPDVVLAPSPQILLPAPQTLQDNTEVLSAIDILREELHEAMADLAHLREAREDTSRLEASLTAARAEAEVYASERKQMQEYLDRARAGEEAERSRLVELRVRIAELEAADRASRAELERVQEETVSLRSEQERTRVELMSVRSELKIAQANLESTQSESLSALAKLESAQSESMSAQARLESAEAESLGALAKLESARSESISTQAELISTQAKLVSVQSELESARSEWEDGRGQVESVRPELESLRTNLQVATGELDRVRSEAEAERAQLSARIDALQSDLDQTRGEAGELESALSAAREEGASLAGRVTELELALSAARATDAARAEEIAGLHRVLETERARAIALSGDVNDERTKAATLHADLELERGRVAAERALRERLELDGTIHEEAAERLRIRIDELEQGLAETTGSADTAAAELRRAVDAERQRADAAIAERQRIEAEFDEKLQTIVGHLAADHEADLGKAVEEREEARAEARSVSLKISVVQRKMEEERAAISSKLRDADERHRRALEDSSRLLGEMRAAAQIEIELLRARITHLENAALPPATGRPRILIVYPDADLRSTARGLLERSGYDVLSAADGLEAMRVAIAQRPDVVIADAVMPKMNGRELCQLLKSQEKTSRIRVILLTRAGDDPPHGDFPPDEVLRKPVPLETLKATLVALTTK